MTHGADLSDARLVYITGQNSMPYPSLVGTKITDGDVAELEQALANCKIEK